MFPRSVSTTRRVHVRDRTLRDGCVHTFLTYEVMSMRHIGGRVCMQLFTYEIMSEIIGLTHAKDGDVYSL